MTEETPQLSICIVSWRTRKQLETCLRSLFETLEGMRFEVIVVENASGDGTAETVKNNWPQVRLLENSRNVGFPKAANQALSASCGHYLLLLNPDTTVLEGTIQNLLSFMETRPEAGAGSCRILNPDGTLQTECRRRLPTLTTELLELTGLSRLFPNHPFFGQWRMPNWDPREPSEIELASGACLLIRRKVLEEVGLLNEDAFMYLEDLDYCYRIVEKGWKIFFYPDAAIIHQGQQSSTHGLPFVRALSYDARHKFFKMYYGAWPARALRIMVVSAMMTRLLVYLPVFALSQGTRRRDLRFSLKEFRHTLYWGLTLREPDPALIFRSEAS